MHALYNSPLKFPFPLSLSQESCARVLLFRGADKTVQNFANQDAFQVAVIAGNSELSEVIRQFKSEDVGKCFRTNSYQIAMFVTVDIHIW